MVLRTKKIALFSLFCALGTVISFFENLLPIFNIIPGGKIGLANCVTMVVFSLFSPLETLLFGLFRGLLSSVLFSGFQSFIYSAVGTIFSVTAMAVLKKIIKRSVTEIGISVIGALFFNIGQILVCAVVVSNVHVFRYLSVLGIISVVSGMVTGYISKMIILYIGAKNIGMEK